VCVNGQFGEKPALRAFFQIVALTHIAFIHIQLTYLSIY
jgi:hypothetical protein